ncbi:MAG: DUF427 domain-containing protein [Gammaproteobacteria bacterium]|nr:DUF427 domain-containing protein [Gammaproteobacteria bacterium]NNF60833.1 DUF427 domain-containing protein [Gammaproteobacteria bacterium]
MAHASWNGTIIAKSDDVVKLEGNLYFPADSLVQEHFEASKEKTRCPWKGVACYYDVVVNGERNAAAAWYYPKPKKAAAEISGRVAFWRGVKVAD